jgi:Protein of unknown function (DUF3180)
VGLLVGGLVGPLFEAAGRQPPRVPWSGVLILVFLAAVLLALARTTWRTLRGPAGAVRRIEPQRAVMLLALGRASALGGAALFAGYSAFALGFLGDDAPLPRERLVRGLLTAAAALLVAAGGLLLERSCRVPGADDEDDARRGTGNGSSDGTSTGAEGDGRNASAL